MKKRFTILWIIWTLFGASLIYGVMASESKESLLSILATVVSISPLFGLMLALGSLKASQQFNGWLQDKNSLYYMTGGMIILFSVPGLLTGSFNPYYTVIFAVIIFAVFGALKQAKNKDFIFNWTDLVIWMLLWIPFDLRWSMEILPAVDSISYTWWAIAVSAIGIVGWYGYRGADIGFNLVPKLKDVYVSLLALIVIMAVLIPPGIATGFLSFSIPETYDFPKLAIHFIGLFLTVALPEELFFRGILLRGLEGTFSKKWIPMAISSLAFGLMHWNNVDTLSTQIIYVSLASVAGLGYGLAYKKSGNNLLAAILVHTLVDWIWKLFLTG